jgi:hypothetical protein
MVFILSPDYLYKELTAMLMKAERREESKRRTITSYSEHSVFWTQVLIMCFIVWVNINYVDRYLAYLITRSV